MQEFMDAIKKAKLNKAPGPDGFTAMYYKVFKEDLAPLLLEVMNDVMAKGEIPESWKEATISLIPKQDRDSTQVKKYRPISLLNVDY